MAGRNPVELATGAVVLVVAAGFLTYAIANNGTSGGSGYRLHAAFDHIDGLAVGADVRLAGVKVGTVLGASIDPRSFLADVTLSVRDDLHLPTDSSAEVTSDGLLGGKYLALSPGGAEQTLPSGGTITVTQGSVSLEQLLGKFIFSVTDMVNAVKPGGATPTPGAAPGSAAGASAGSAGTSSGLAPLGSGTSPGSAGAAASGGTGPSGGPGPAGGSGPAGGAGPSGSSAGPAGTPLSPQAPASLGTAQPSAAGGAALGAGR